MRAALIAAGRKLFIDKGFAATGTPEIVAAAGVTRGALYHHFADKQELFAAVIRSEAEAIAAMIESSSGPGVSPVEALILGGEAFLAAMREPGRARLMLVEAPAALTPETLAEIDATTGGRTLEDGLRAAGVAEPGPTAALLSAACDRAALAIDQGSDPRSWHAALRRVITGILP